MLKKILFVIFFSFWGYTGHSQILISIIFGDKLNSEGLEFGLDGGVNFSKITGLESNAYASNLHLGFYFDVRLKNQFWLNTGVLVKSSQGSSKLTKNDVLNLYPDLDSFAVEGNYSQSLGFFNVPIMLKYRFENHIYAGLGFQASLLMKARLNYSHAYENIEITSSIDNRDWFKRVDVGLVGGFGYKLRQGNGINLGVKYYAGLIDITKSSNSVNRNNVIYVKVDIPIGKDNQKKEKK